MTRSAGLRFIIVGALAFLMFLPLGLVSDIVRERADYSDQTISGLSDEWGGKHLFSGPLLQIPVSEDVTYDRRREAVDAVSGLTLRDEKGNPIFEHFEETVTEARAPVYLYPVNLDIEVDSKGTTRARGIFEVPVYTADVRMGFDFDAAAAEGALRGDEVLHWDEASLSVFLTSNRGLRGEARMTADGREMALEPVSGGVGRRTGITTALGDRPALRHLMFRNFSAPRSAPNPASVTT